MSWMQGSASAPRRKADGAPRIEKKQEHAVLCGVVTPEEGRRFEAMKADPLEELSRLARTAGAQVEGAVVQRRAKPDVATYVGRGKVEEIGMLLAATDGNLVISDDDLTPGQGRKLEKALEARVIDRSQLILDIFARHARSKQARLQVELAQLEYTMPRLKRMWTHLERLGGGIGTNGPGETQIETDRRIIRKKITDTRRELQSIKERKEREVASRKEFFTIGLVGYTNAGKSTLHVAMTGSRVEIADRLFATLDTKTSMLVLPGGGRALISDTVGFIRKLPHHLVECFHATLEEARHADLLLHVVDASHPDAREQKQVVKEVLAELGLDATPTVLVLNKIDQVAEPFDLATLADSSEETVRISAKSGKGLDQLLEVIRAHQERGMTRVRLILPAGDGRTLALLAEKTRVNSRDFDAEGNAILDVTLPHALLSRLQAQQPLMRAVAIRDETH